MIFSSPISKTRKPVSPELWGKDHFTTLLYIESVYTDKKGVPEATCMRTWPGRPSRETVDTSKTVSWTGEIIDNLGGRKVIKSKLDKQEMDRDYNGARGIFLRALGDQPILKKNLQNTSASKVTSLVAFDSEK